MRLGYHEVKFKVRQGLMHLNVILSVCHFQVIQLV